MHSEAKTNLQQSENINDAQEDGNKPLSKVHNSSDQRSKELERMDIVSCFPICKIYCEIT